jgi:hypothetical protein
MEMLSVTWKFNGSVMARCLDMYDLKSEIEFFLQMKGKPFLQLCDYDCMCDFAFCTDITQHMNELNINLQGANHLTNEMCDKITMFEKEHSMWEMQL